MGEREQVEPKDGPEEAHELHVRLGEGGEQRRHVDRVAERLVARRVDHVAQHLLRVLDAAALRVPVAHAHELLLLRRPQAAHTLAVQLRAPSSTCGGQTEPERERESISGTRGRALSTRNETSLRFSWITL